jgi:hypothetical protein
VVLVNLPKGFTTAVSMDESFFFFDSIIRKVWIFRSTRPVVRIAGSHQHSSLFGGISLDGRQSFRQYHHFDEKRYITNSQGVIYSWIKHLSITDLVR